MEKTEYGIYAHLFKCFFVYLLKAWFKAVQAMEILGFLCLLAAVVVVILKLFVLKDKPILKFVGIGCLATAGN